MGDVSANTPVIVGVGFYQEKSSELGVCPEASEMMLRATRDAAKNAGNESLLQQFQSIAVQKGSWSYKDPGKLLADELGCSGAKSILADLGVLQIMPFFELCDAIKNEEQKVGLVVGGESRFRDLCYLKAGQEAPYTVQGDDVPEPDVFYATPDPFSSELEQSMGIWAPGEFYALAESTIRHAKGLSLEEHKQLIAEMYSGFSDVAVENPHAWRQEHLSVDDIKTVTDKNAMIAFPYTKNLMSQWNVNQAVAVIACSYAYAKEMGLDESRFIYPLSGSISRNVVNLSQKPTLHTHPGLVKTGEKVMQLAEVTADEIEMADLYSCFPSAIQASTQDLKLKADCPVNLTGTMAYGGGPFNHGALDSIARMVEVLRERESKEKVVGLVNNLSGMFGKQGCGLLSNQPGKQFAYEDITEELKQTEIPIPLNGDYTGPATVIAYTVMFNKDQISHALAYCDTPDGERTVVRSDDKVLCERLMEEEYIGQNVVVTEDCCFIL